MSWLAIGWAVALPGAAAAAPIGGQAESTETTSSATGSSLRLSWRAPAGCPGASEIVRDIEGRRGRAVTGDEFVASGRVSVDEEGRWRLRLETSDGGERDLEGESCARVSEAAGLVLALVLDARPARATTPEISPPRPVASPVENKTWVGAFGFASAGGATRGGAGPALAGGLRAGAWGVEIGGLWVLPHEVAAPTAGYRASFVGGTLRGCYSPLRGTLEAGACASFEGGRLHVGAEGAPDPTCRTAPWAAVNAGGRFAWNVDGFWALSARVEGGPSLGSPTFCVARADGRGNVVAYDTVFRPAPWGGRGLLGVELRIF